MFGQHLLARGLVTEEQLELALAAQRRATPSIARLAHAHGHMSAEEVVRVLEQQERESLSFEELAVRNRYLTPEVRDWLVTLHRDSRRPLGDWLVELGILDAEMVKEELSDYLRSR